MFMRQIFDDKLAQYAYLIGCQQTGEAIVIDPERDVDRYVDIAEANDLRIVASAETHIHADFLSGSRELAERFGARLFVSDEGDADWKYEWVKDGDYDTRFLKDGDEFRIGHILFTVVHTPGHTPEHISFLVTDLGGGASEPIGMLTGDFVFVGDVGRPDLLEKAARIEGAMEPSARRLHGSITEFLDLPDFIQVWPAHGAGSACGKALGAVPESTVGYEKRFSPAIDFARRGEDDFVEFILSGQPEPPMYFARMKRDNKLGVRVLGTLPAPGRLSADELGELAGRPDAVVIDARPSRSDFMAAHLPGSLYAPLDSSFNTVVGSLVADETQPIYLILDEEDVEEAVRDLVRIGYDNIVGYAEPESLQRYFRSGGESARIEEIDLERMRELAIEGSGHVLDVRYASEFDAGHVPDAVNAAYTRLPDSLENLPADRPLLVHCQTGRRAAAASAFLARNGFDVRYVNDVWTSYAAKHEVVRGEPVLA
ncbi:MAG: rhodanese-like domain-containing protein [Gemmatimonadota bacterium]|nr:rhodanese-like domain-containing protein [Gemmatimonadota bacterium]